MNTKPKDVTDELLEMSRMFCANACEEPNGPHGTHSIHFTADGLSDLQDTCDRAIAEINRLRDGHSSGPPTKEQP